MYSLVFSALADSGIIRFPFLHIVVSIFMISDGFLFFVPVGVSAEIFPWGVMRFRPKRCFGVISFVIREIYPYFEPWGWQILFL